MHGDFQFASLQGYLLKNRRRPRECVEGATEWYGTVNCNIVVTGELRLYVTEQGETRAHGTSLRTRVRNR